MPTIYSPKLSEVYRTTFYTIPSTLEGWISLGDALVTDGTGATVWEQITGSNASIESVNVLNTISTAKLFTNYLSSGNMVLNIIESPLVSTNILSTGTLKTYVVNTQNLSCVNIFTSSISIHEMNANRVQTNEISTASFLANVLNLNSLNAENLSTSSIELKFAFTSTLNSDNIIANSIKTNAGTFVTCDADITTANIVKANNISTGVVFLSTMSSIELFTSSINGLNYNQLSDIGPDLLISTGTIQKTLTTQSTISKTVSTAVAQVQFGNIVELDARQLYGNTMTTTNGRIHNLSTNTLSSGTINTTNYTASYANSREVSSIQTTSVNTSISTLFSYSLNAQSAITSQIYANSIGLQNLSTGSFRIVDGEFNLASTFMISSGKVYGNIGNLNNIQTNNVSSLNTNSATLDLNTGFTSNIINANKLETNYLSSLALFTDVGSTLAAYASSINGKEFPVIFSVSPDLIVSTAVVSSVTSTISTFMDIVSTAHLDAPIITAATVSTNILSKGSVTAIEAVFSSGVISSIITDRAILHMADMSFVNTSNLFVSTFFAQNVITSTSYTNTTLSHSTITNSGLFASTVIDYLSSGIMIANTGILESFSTIQLLTSTLNTSTLTTEDLLVNIISANQGYINELHVSSVNSYAVNIMKLKIPSSIVDTISVNTISSGVSEADILNANTMDVNQVSTLFGSIMYADFNIQTITPLYSTLGFTVQPKIIEANIISTNTVSSAVLHVDNGTTANLSSQMISSGQFYAGFANTSTITASTINGLDIIMRTGVIDNMNTNETYVNAIGINYGTVNNISTTLISTANDLVEIANFNNLDISILSAGTLIFNSLLASTLSTNSISSLMIESGSASIDILETNNLQSISTNVNTLSVGVIYASSISTYTQTVWGPNTLIVQGSTILDGYVINQNGAMTISTVNVDEIAIDSLSSISTFGVSTAIFSTLFMNDLIGSTVTTSNLLMTGDPLYANYVYSGTMNASTLISDQISTNNTRALAMYASTLTILSFKTLSSFFDRDLLVTDKIVANYVEADISVSTSHIFNSQIAALSAIITSLSTNFVSTAQYTFMDMNTNLLHANMISAGFMSVGTTQIDTTNLTTLSKDTININSLTGLNISTNSLSTFIVSTNNLRFDSFSIDNISTNLIFSGQGSFDTISTNILPITSLNNPLITISSLNANRISAGTVNVSTTINPIFATNNLSVGVLRIGAPGGGNITTSSISTNVLSTSEIIGTSGIFSGVNLSTNTISAGIIRTNLTILSSCFTNTLSAGTISQSSIRIVNVSANSILMSSMIYRLGGRSLQVSTNTLITSNVTGAGMFVDTFNMSTNGINTLSFSMLNMTGNTISTITLSGLRDFSLDQFICGYGNIQVISAQNAIISSVNCIELNVSTISAVSIVAVNSYTNNISTGRFNSENYRGQYMETSTISSANSFINSLYSFYVYASSINNIRTPFAPQTTISTFIGNQIATSTFTAINLDTLLLSTNFIGNNSLTVNQNASLSIKSYIDRWVLVNTQQPSLASGRICYSDDDGLTWISSPIGSTAPNGILNYDPGACDYNGSYFLITSTGSPGGGAGRDTIARSYNGINWSTIRSPFTTGTIGVKWNGNIWVCWGATGDISSTLTYSYNGSNFFNSVATSTTTISMRSIAYNGRQWLGVGNVQPLTFVRSTDGISWTPFIASGINNTVTYTRHQLIWGGKFWVLGLDGNVPATSSILYSYNGSNWFSSRSGGSATGCKNIEWNGSVFIASLDSPFTAPFASTIQISYDGSNWINSGNMIGEMSGPAAWNGSYWLIGSNGGTNNLISSVLISYDNGKSWNARGTNLPGATAAPQLLYSISKSPDLVINNISFYTRNVIGYYTDSHNILTSISTLIIDETVRITRDTNQFIINTAQYEVSTASLIVNGVLYCSGEAYKPTTNVWSQPSDQRIKTDIQLADYELCYNTMKNIPLYRYKYVDAVMNTTPHRDKHILGFIAQDVSNYFPKAVSQHSLYGYDDLLILDQSQLNVMHYGATRHLMSINKRHGIYISSLYHSTILNSSLYASSLLEACEVMEQQYSNISTNMENVIIEYESTIASNFITLSTMTSRYNHLSSLLSTLEVMKQVPSQPPPESV